MLTSHACVLPGAPTCSHEGAENTKGSAPELKHGATEPKRGVCLARKLLATTLEPTDVAEKLADNAGLKVLDRWHFLDELK